MGNMPRETFPVIYHPDKGYIAILKIRYAGKSRVLSLPRAIAHDLGWGLGDRLAMRCEPRELRVIRLISKENKEALRTLPSIPKGTACVVKLRKVGNSISFTIPGLITYPGWPRGYPLAVWYEDPELIAIPLEDLFLSSTRLRREKARA